MQTFPLGSFHVGRVGFGAMQLPGPGVFGPPRDHDQAIAVLRRAIELGINHIDTSQYYGPNVSNELIREALHPYPADLALVSKVGARRDDAGGWQPAQEPDELRAGIEENLRTLDVDCLAAVNLRTIGTGDATSVGPVDRDRFDRQLSVMIKARDEGLIAGIGLSGISLEHLQIALDRTEIVCVQNAYNLVDRASQPVLDACIGTRHRVRAVLPARLRLHCRQSGARPPSRTARSVEARTHAGADRARMDAIRRAERLADSWHLVGGTPRGEHRRRRHRTG